VFFRYQRRLERSGKEPLIAPSLLKTRQLTGGLITFLFLFLIQAGIFFTVPLFLSVVVGLSPMATGVRLLPLSLSLLVAAAGIPRFFPRANPRRVCRLGMLALLAGIVLLIAGLQEGADSSIVFVPMLIVGAGIGALASQLGAVTVSALPTEKSSDVGGLQNTATQLGASLGTALAGSILIIALTASFLTGIQNNPNVSQQAKSQATTNLAAGAPFISDKDLETEMKAAGYSDEEIKIAVDQNEKSQIAGLRAALAVLAVMGVISLFFSGRIPRQPVGAAQAPA
jgi:Na+/melibiose symporter-like transporter